MSSKEKQPSIIAFHYNVSPYARKVTTYLRLLGQDYAECVQPVIMPRPDLSALGINYRRIPVVAINGQIYCDTHLIFKELEKLLGSKGCLGEAGKTEEMQTMEDSWEDWADATFFDVVKCLPKQFGKIMPPGFWEDRRSYAGGALATKPDELLIARSKGLLGIKRAFERLENGELADNRPFLFSGRETPTLADVKSQWVLEFAMNLPGVLDEAGVDAQKFPKTFAWIDRFRSFVASKRDVQIQSIDGKEAKTIILAQYKTRGKADVTFDHGNALGLKQGAQIEVLPTDVGRTHPQAGSLVGLDNLKFTLETRTPDGQSVLVHLPRRNFEVARLGTNRGMKL